MKNIKWLLVVSCLLVIGGVTGYFVVEANSNSQNFRSISHTGANKELLTNYETVFIGMDMKWEGNQESLPLIKDIQLLKKDETELNSSDDSLQVNLLVDETGETNLHYLDTYENKVLKEAYLPVTDYQLKESRFTLVFEVSLLDPSYEYDLDALQITYQEQGKEQTTKIPLRSFIFNN